MAKLWIPVAVLFLALMASHAGAQPMIRKGDRELSVHVSPDFEGAIGDMIDARAGFGWFVRDGLAARATVAFALLEDVAGEDSDYRMRELGLAGEYHFRRNRASCPMWGSASAG